VQTKQNQLVSPNKRWNVLDTVSVVNIVGTGQHCDQSQQRYLSSNTRKHAHAVPIGCNKL